MGENEYMRSVKWSTAIYFFASVSSILLAVAGIYYGLKGDIKDGRAETRALVLAVNHKVDSIHREDQIEHRDIWKAIGDIPNQSPDVNHVKVELFTQQIVNGKRVFIPFKK